MTWHRHLWDKPRQEVDVRKWLQILEKIYEKQKGSISALERFRRG